MSLPVTEETFDKEVLERSQDVPVVVDFWADWCGPCKALSPALEKAEAARVGRVVLAKVDVDANPRLAALFKVQGIPAVKAFRDGQVVGGFVGALPPPRVEAFFDSLIPSQADELLSAGDELSLREAAELEPGRTDVALALARARLARGAEEEAFEAVKGHESNFAAGGIAARVRLIRAGIGVDAFAALDRGERETALDSLIDSLTRLGASGDGDSPIARGDASSEASLDAVEARDLLRRAVIGILSESDPGDPTARAYRRKLSIALG